MKKIYTILGIAAPLLYISAVIIGGFVIDGYSQLYNTVSELTSSPLPVIQVPIALYNLFLAIFGIGLLTFSHSKNLWKMKIASVLLIAIGFLGLGMYFFPQDPRTVEMTLRGKIHIILAGMASLFTMLSMLSTGISFRKDLKMKRFATYSFVSVIMVFITGGTAAASVANNSAFGGLFERLVIGSFIQWVFVLALYFLLSNNKTTTSRTYSPL